MGKMIHCPTNEFYGHAEVFRKYAGIEKNIPINGRLQHGWGAGLVAGDSLDKQGIRFFAWTEKYAKYGYNHERRDVPLDKNRTFIVGAPILYMPKGVCQIAPLAPRGILAIPSHSITENKIPRRLWEDWCKYVLYTYGCKTDVLIHWRDIELGYDKIAMEYGLGVKNCGKPTDVDFLRRTVAILQSYDLIVSNCLQTACFYALYLGSEVAIDGPATPKDPPDVYDHLVFDNEWIEKEYPALDEIVAEEELGMSFVKTPEEVRELMFSYA